MLSPLFKFEDQLDQVLLSSEVLDLTVIVVEAGVVLA